jgi:hypothetical protein
MRLDGTGALGIGTSSLTGYTLRLNKNITGSANPQVFAAGGTIQTDATGVVVLIGTSLQTVASANSSNVYHYNTGLGSIGAGTVIGNLYGYVASGLTQGTNNFGFYGNIPAAANRWNLYMNGTANNYMAGSLGIGTTSLTQANLSINKNLTGSTTMYGILNIGQVQSDVTTNVNYYATFSTVQNTAFTLGELVHYRADSAGGFGAATVTNQYGFFVQNSLTGATNDFGFYGNLASASNVWNLYMAGTAANYMAGQVAIGTTTLVATAALNVSSTTQGFLPPRMTTTQKNAISSPATGLVVFDTTLGKLCVFATTWQTITSA